SHLPDGCELVPQGMGGIDLVVPVGADQQQVPHVRLGQQVLEQVQRRRVEPLQIIEKERERMLRPREDADESAQHQLETPLRVLWQKFRNWGLFSDDELQFRDEVHHEPSIGTYRLTQRLTPTVQLSFALAQQRADQALKGLCQRGIR